MTPAEQFEMRAHEQVSHDNWLPVAADLEKAARLRPANDPEALNDLMGAATLYSSVGRPSIALSILDEVARRAEHIGAIDLSEQVDENGEAAFCLSRLEDLARRPGVTEEQKKVVFGPLGLAPQHCN